MADLKKTLATKPTANMILADFSDGSWHAISFAMHFLYIPKSPIFILQTYQNPNFGQSMLRNLIPHLKEITKYELNSLKTKLLNHFNIKAKHIKLLSLNGELVSILKNEPNFEEYNIVIGSANSITDSFRIQNQCLTKIINGSNNPIFIIPQQFGQLKDKKILFVANAERVPSIQIKNQILNICEKTNSGLDILFVLKKKSQEVNKEVHDFIEKYFKNVDLSINYVINTTVCKGMKNYIKNNCKDLIIVERTQSEYLGYS